ncbi:hypothetical protein [Deinococcus sp. AJ005]|uniref:hypothetical protein n=1 Tax=Deinococcus sp. AJ005 TaxID=2652443 RepID=UPI00125CB12C|nr:hypothetical protein [Deinococcus sp. AJ005]QFP77501.1 hypothetical protein DAAJ005_14290 [Deinococcus sp. AJ005]
MRVGLLNSPASRLRAYWAAYLKELDVEAVTPALDDAEALALGQQSLPGEPTTVQLALGRILALEAVDAVLLPEWPAVSNDAWSEALTELLPRRISGLPTLIPVPDLGGPDLEGHAAEVGLRVSQNGSAVRGALTKVRLLAAEPRISMPPLGRAGLVTVAVIGPRTLLAEDVLSGSLRPALEAAGLHGVFSPELPHSDVMRRAERMHDAAKVPAGERELFGAASMLAGKSAVRGVLLVSPAHDGAAAAALDRIAAKMHLPTLRIDLNPGQTEFDGLEAFAEKLNPTALLSTTPPSQETP